MTTLRPFLISAALLGAPGAVLSQSEPFFDMTLEADLRIVDDVPVADTAQNASAAGEPPAPDALRYLIPDDALWLQGENARSDYEVFLTGEQAAAEAQLHLGFLNALVVAPEGSRLRVRINETVVLNAPIDSPTEPRSLVVDIPAGVLQAGPNQLEIDANQRHRTDCTLDSTYELWTDIDPEQTYLAFWGQSAGRLSSLGDLAATGVNARGETTIRLIVPGRSAVEMGSFATELVQALALALRTPNPVVELASEPSKAAPGVLDVLLGTADSLPDYAASFREEAGQGPVSALLSGRDMANLLVLSGPDEAALEESIAAVANVVARYQTPADMIAARADRPRLTPLLDGEGSIVLSNAGLATTSFNGRRWVSAFEFALPADFYASSYGEANLILNAAFSPEVAQGSQIEAFVNGQIASVTPILRTGNILRQIDVKVPMTNFRPGVNRVQLTAALRTQADDICAPGTVTVGTDSRMLFSGDSRFVVPDFARISASPDLGAFVNHGASLVGPEPAHLVVGSDREAVAAGLTAIARLSATSSRIVDFDSIRFASPSPAENAFFVGAYNALPPDSMPRVGLLEPYVGEVGATGQQGADVQGTLQRWRDTGTSGASTLVGRFQHWVADLFSLGPNSLGIFPPRDAPYAAQVSDQAVLVQAVQPEGGSWTMLMVPESERTKLGIEAFTSADTWSTATGRVAALREAGGSVESVVANRVTFTATVPFDIQNMRLVAANWLSHHVLAYALGLGIVLLLLSLATSRVLGSFGRSEQ